MSEEMKPKHNDNSKNVQTKIMKNAIKDLMEKTLIDKEIIENTIIEYLKKENVNNTRRVLLKAEYIPIYEKNFTMIKYRNKDRAYAHYDYLKEINPFVHVEITNFTDDLKYNKAILYSLDNYIEKIKEYFNIETFLPKNLVVFAFQQRVCNLEMILKNHYYKEVIKRKPNWFLELNTIINKYFSNDYGSNTVDNDPMTINFTKEIYEHILTLSHEEEPKEDSEEKTMDEPMKENKESNSE